jgi:MinD superfamily P-loop ATPase
MKNLKSWTIFEGRKERQKKEPEVDLSEYSKSNRCKANCQTKVVHTEEGPKVLCTYCKRIVREIKR